ncbi:TRAP transporter small permease [Mesobaculum littorinae]|uniref:TRAP transporter small permease protein n=1 Tax=Mesobaculum littorinae TaxID=2486419 RepID=A0A438AHF0_9RHOB|nr:TRAP transporter small permease [Mesobaculum littorinae]RVV98112.1 TRAP transporter small permease [Mesobaculum littorinae]
MIRTLERICQAVEVIAGLLLGAVTLLVVASAVGRYLFAAPVPDAFDISRLMIGACIMWGFASVGYRGTHIKVDLFVEMVGPRIRRWVDFFAWAVLLVFVVLLTWKMLGRVESAFASNESTFDLRLPVWPVMTLIWIGTAFSIFTVAVRMFLIAAGLGTLDPEDPAEMRVD